MQTLVRTWNFDVVIRGRILRKRLLDFKGERGGGGVEGLIKTGHTN